MSAYAAASLLRSWYIGEKLTNMQIRLPEDVNYIIEHLEAAGYEAFAVGGCVRDSILGREPDDWDITTSAKPEMIKSLFQRTVDTGIEHGTVTVLIGKNGYEVTTYRIDGNYSDARHPDQVTFTSDLTEDLKRRDFTINAMAYSEKAGLVDVFGGRQDLKEGVIRAVGEAQERFAEDALRMLRAVRFSAQLGFLIEEKTAAAIKRQAYFLEKVSAERIRVELVKLIASDYPEKMRDAYKLGLTRIFLPEFDVMMRTPQNTPHHMYSVGEHTIHAIMNIRKDPLLRLVMLFHDISKPECRTTDEFGRDHFKGHPIAGQKLTSQIMRRLKFDNATRLRVCQFVLWHDANPELTEKSVRRLISKIGLDYFPEMFEVKTADIHAQSDYMREDKEKKLAFYRQTYEKVLEEKNCVSLKDLEITGKDLMELGIPQGKQIGALLHKALEYVVDEPSRNNREELIEFIKSET
jgi:tRNA nucleotidyltransferase (CCA-adding enzyme)